MQPHHLQALAPRPPLTATLKVLTSASIYRTQQIASTGHARLGPQVLGSQVQPTTIPMAQQQVFQSFKQSSKRWKFCVRGLLLSFYR